MAYVINEPCIGTKDTSCVEVCPVDCIHPTAEEPGFEVADQLYIDPEDIDCDACVERARWTRSPRRTWFFPSGTTTSSATPPTTEGSAHDPQPPHRTHTGSWRSSLRRRAHLIGPPAASHWTTRPARSRVCCSPAELADCLTTLEQDPERFQCAAARWHALWCIDLEALHADRGSDGADGAPGARRAPRPRGRRHPAIPVPAPRPARDARGARALDRSARTAGRFGP